MNTNVKIQGKQDIETLTGRGEVTATYEVIDNNAICDYRLRLASSNILYDDLAENITRNTDPDALIGYYAETSELTIPQANILRLIVRISTSGDDQKIFIFRDVPIWPDPIDQQTLIVGNITSTGFEFNERGGASFTKQFMLDHGLTSESELNIMIMAYTD